MGKALQRYTKHLNRNRDSAPISLHSRRTSSVLAHGTVSTSARYWQYLRKVSTVPSQGIVSTFARYWQYQSMIMAWNCRCGRLAQCKASAVFHHWLNIMDKNVHCRVRLGRVRGRPKGHAIPNHSPNCPTHRVLRAAIKAAPYGGRVIDKFN